MELSPSKVTLTEDAKAREAEEEEMTQEKPPVAELAEWELQVVTRVFRSFETGLREGTMKPKVRQAWKNGSFSLDLVRTRLLVWYIPPTRGGRTWVCLP